MDEYSHQELLNLFRKKGGFFNNNLVIKNIGGDAIDTSGSNLKISNLRVSHVIDKAISAGESSNVSISQCFLEDIGVGIASKDGSHVLASECNIKNVELAALMSYVKKDFYGNPSLNNCSSGKWPLTSSITSREDNNSKLIEIFIFDLRLSNFMFNLLYDSLFSILLRRILLS